MDLADAGAAGGCVAWVPRREELPDGEVRLWAPLRALRLDAGNVNDHPQHNLDGIAASLQEFGQQKPIKINEMDVVQAGNGTVMAARKLGWSEIWYSRSNLAGARQVGYNIADNQTGRTSKFDEVRLGMALQGVLFDGGVPVAATGFSEAEVDAFLEKLKDSAEKTPAEPHEWKPNFELVVQCPSEVSKRELLERLTREGFACR